MSITYLPVRDYIFIRSIEGIAGKAIRKAVNHVNKSVRSVMLFAYQLVRFKQNIFSKLNHVTEDTDEEE